MDRIEKELAKLTIKERRIIAGILQKLRMGKTKGLDIKKLKGREDIFRVRKGDLRIIYHMQRRGIFVLAIERRREDTYNV